VTASRKQLEKHGEMEARYVASLIEAPVQHFYVSAEGSNPLTSIYNLVRFIAQGAGSASASTLHLGLERGCANNSP